MNMYKGGGRWSWDGPREGKREGSLPGQTVGPGNLPLFSMTRRPEKWKHLGLLAERRKNKPVGSSSMLLAALPELCNERSWAPCKLTDRSEICHQRASCLYSLTWVSSAQLCSLVNGSEMARTLEEVFSSSSWQIQPVKNVSYGSALFQTHKITLKSTLMC